MTLRTRINIRWLENWAQDGYPAQRLDKLLVIEFIGVGAVTQLNFEVFLLTDKRYYAQFNSSITGISIIDALELSSEKFIADALEEMDLNIVINTKVANVQFLNPNFTAIEYTVSSGKPNYKIYFEYTDFSRH